MGFGLNNFVQQNANGGVTSIEVDGVPSGGTLILNPATGELQYRAPNGVISNVGWRQEQLNVNLNGIVKYDNSTFTIDSALFALDNQNVSPVSGPASDMIEIKVDGATRYLPII